MAKTSASNATKKAAAKKKAAQKASVAPAATKAAGKKDVIVDNPPAATIKENKTIKPKVSAEQFIKEVRLEAQKVTWPSRREVIITTILVLVLVTIASLFLLLVDFSLQAGMKNLLNWFMKT